MRGEVELPTGLVLQFSLTDGFSVDYSAPSHIPSVGESIRVQLEEEWGADYDLVSVVGLWTFEEEWKLRSSYFPSYENMPDWRRELLENHRKKAEGMSESGLLNWLEEVDNPFEQRERYDAVDASGITIQEVMDIISAALIRLPTSH